jgi:regulator of protease activity HflC (stomatin/prohibitin superfamily)
MSKKKLALRILAGLALVGLVYSTLVITPFGHRSVIWSVGGISYEEREPGLSFIFPLVQRSHQVDTREQRYITIDAEGKANAFVQSLDLQEITVRASLVYRIVPDQTAELYDDVGPEYTQRIVEPIFFDAIKEAGGQRVALSFAEELSSIADDIEAIVTPQLGQRGIVVMSVALEDAVFDPLFITAVKEKVIADQEAAEQLKLVEAERARATQIELQAGAEKARAAALGLSPAEYLEWLWLQRWDGVLPKTLLGDATSVILSGIE